MKRTFAALCAALLMLLPGCSQPQQNYQTSFFDVFDTFTTFSGYAKNEKAFTIYSQIVYDEMLRLHQLFDIYNDYPGINNLKTVNDNAGIAPVEVEPDLIDLLEQSRQAYEDTDGAVNVALGSVLQVWHRYRDQGLEDPDSAQLPPAEELAEAAKHVDIAQLVIDREASTVFLTDPDMSLDVGALAKGYATQSAVDLIKKAGFTSGILNAGGNVCTIGQPSDGRTNWSVAVQDPDLAADGTQQVYDTIYTNDSAVVSSGDYQRFYLVNGISYHHIIDPVTLAPASQCRAVSIVHSDATIADILSTAGFILPHQEAVALVERLGGQGVWILVDGSAVSTSGYSPLSKNAGAVAG